MQFSRLSITGFKSFVDRAELTIAPGLTGIVGPNGCGKSNLVEALRWVMGENSAKRMRGGEMDDVIFGGTSSRPARNLAEVALLVENTGEMTPLPFGGQPELEIARRIHRGAGSDFRINGKEVRARDVQLLFADAATGAHSTALVSQGRIGAIINAKPAERRGILEEAAGISGLHSRRREAELRLQAAESNLERLDDVIVTLQAQFDNLKKQARQAARYRKLSEQIRTAEAILLYLRWDEALLVLERAATALREAERHVGALTEGALANERARSQAADALPGLREEAAAGAAELQRLVRAREALDDEERRTLVAQEEAQTRRRQLALDRGREDELAADAAAAIARLAEERRGLEEAQKGEVEAQRAAGERLREAADAVAALETEIARRTEDLANAEARRAALTRQQSEAEEKLRRLDQRVAEIAHQRRALEEQRPDAMLLSAAAATVARAEAELESARTAAEQAEKSLIEARQQENAARAPMQSAEAARAKLRAEIQALQELLSSGGRGKTPPLLDAITVEPGFEAALAAALGEDLAAPLGTEEARRWQELPPYDDPPALPAGIVSIAAHVLAPPALTRRLGQIGIVTDAGQASAAIANLRPGQRLVSREGALWRWDGFMTAAGAPSGAAQRLRQRNRLIEAGEALRGAEQSVVDAQSRLAAAAGRATEIANAEAAARQAMRQGLGALGTARDRQAELIQRDAALQSRLSALAESETRLCGDRGETDAQRQAAMAALANLADSTAGRAELAERRAAVAELRGVQLAAQSDLDRLLNEAAGRRQRLAAIALEDRSWQNRAAGAEKQRAALSERDAALITEIERLAAIPAEIAAQRSVLAETIEAAMQRRSQTGDALASGETALAAAEREQKESDARLAAAREGRLRCELAVEQATQIQRDLVQRIAERLDCAPESIRESAEIDPDLPMPAPAEAESRLEKLNREREGMGPVNLVAESEAAELEQRVAGLTSERADLTAAIARLRQAIQALNREGRERLLAAFAKVNAHFEELFVRLFGGGSAHLSLDEGEDPLAAGIEIMASPPGKRLQSLSLLSGGEQALTALALLFAVFLTNPAPICVLDEVDAPLDDANVDRFCSLVETIAASAETRFLIITHHRVTMARMDRLFGVTMSERGVSQLVSVDLQAAERLRRTA